MSVELVLPQTRSGKKKNITEWVYKIVLPQSRTPAVD